MIYTKVAGTGAYTPENRVTNHDMETIVETSDEWIKSRTGIESRPVTLTENTSDLAYQAALNALDDAQLKPGDLDMIIVATVTPDQPFPGVSQMLQSRLGCRAIPAFDINAACTGFIYALNVADKMINSGGYQHLLIIGAETLTKITDYTDRNTCVLFGDGAGAFVLSKSDTNQIPAILTYAKGDEKGYLKMDGYPMKVDFKTPEQPRPFLEMNGAEVFKFATVVLPSVVKSLLEETQLTLDDIDMIVAHQANKRIIDKAAKTLGVDHDKMFINIDHTGNTSAASVPIAIDEAIKTGALKKGDTMITAAFGAGFTWGGAVIKL